MEVNFHVNDISGPWKLKINPSINVGQLKYTRSVFNFFQIRHILNNVKNERFISFLTHLSILVMLAAFSRNLDKAFIISERNNLINDLHG